MTDKLNISRRDFLNGIALSVAAGSSLSPLELLAQDKGNKVYPPGLTGLRGNHPGSFEVAHAVAWGGTKFPAPASQTDDVYDLVVVGGGISGLSAALFHRQRVGPDARILVLDNHDDFGGHAKRNEFDVDGQKLICYGGSQTIDTPGSYSPIASQLLKDVAIDTQKFYSYYDRDFYRERKLGSGVYFSKEKYAADSVQPSIGQFFAGGDRDEIAKIVNTYPMSDESRQSFIRILSEEKDYFPDMTREQKIAFMKGISYTDFIKRYAGATDEVVVFLRDIQLGFWGFGFDALSAKEGHRQGMPGTFHMGLDEVEAKTSGEDEPYIFHFPDGNAGVARSIVRNLLPGAVPGTSMEDLVLARVDYGRLDAESSNTRIRLNSTAVNVQHTADDKSVDVTYVRGGKTYRVRGKHAVLACYNNIIPHICPELPDKQRQAIAEVTKVPLVYISIAVRNWKAFENLGYQRFYVPQPSLMYSFSMDFPVSMGGYQFTQTSDQPTVIHGTYLPTVPGLTEREQHVQGRRKLYEITWDEFERDIVGQMSGALEGGGFEADRDIAGITVNRWPHGYAYMYNDLYDPPEWTLNHGPHIQGAAQIGRISIANSDASANAYVNGAIDAADRAVAEQLAS